MSSILKHIINLLTSIIMFPVVLVGLISVLTYWVVYFPIWYLKRLKRGDK